jgi:hypothetical protein
VGDEDHRPAASPQVPDDLVEMLHLVGRQAG